MAVPKSRKPFSTRHQNVCNAALKQGHFSSHPSWWSMDEVLKMLPGSLLMANPSNWSSCSGGFSSASAAKFLAGACGGLKILSLICVLQELGGEGEAGRLRGFLKNLLKCLLSLLHGQTVIGLPWTERWQSLISHLLSVAVWFAKGAQGLQKPAALGGNALLPGWWMSCKTRHQSTLD